MTAKEYRKKPSQAWEGRRDYYEFNGIRDSRTGWTKRLKLSNTAFGNRLNLWRTGKIPKEEVFRTANTQSSKTREFKCSLEDRKEIHRLAALKYWKTHAHPPLHTIRVWESVFNAMKRIKPPDQDWSRYFIEKLGLSVDRKTGKPSRP